MQALPELLNSFGPLPSKSRGKESYFVSFEGPEGAGKSTQMDLFESFLKDLGFEVLRVREPGGTPLGEKVREILLHPPEKISPLSEAALFVASRHQLLVQKILPAMLKEKTVVLCDRYIDSSLAYQAYGRGLGLEPILTLHLAPPLCFTPDLTFALEIDVETSETRMLKRGTMKDAFEAEEKSFHQRLSQGYLEIVKLFPKRIRTIDASGPIDQVQKNLQKIWGAFLCP